MASKCEHTATVVVLEGPVSRVLCQQGTTFQLPVVTLGSNEIWTRSVSRMLRREAGISIFVLDWFEMPTNQTVCVARLHATDRRLYKGFLWIESSSDQTLRYEDRAVVDCSRRRQAENDATSLHPLRRFEALDDLRNWYGPILAANHFQEVGMEHWQSGGDACVIRLESDRGSIWLKTVGNDHRTEPSISRGLAAIEPDDFPAVLGTNDAWNGMLLEGIEGPTLNEVTGKEAWLTTAKRLAEIQTGFIDKKDELLAIGCADWRNQRLRQVIPAFFESMIPVMQAQHSVTQQQPLTAAELSLLCSEALWLCHKSETLGIPDTLVHGNFSPHNVIWSKGKPIFLDWAFALIGFPFLSEEYFRHRMMREHPEFKMWAEELQKAYYQPWECLLSRHVLDAGKLLARAVAPLVAAINLYHQDTNAWLSVPMRAPALRSLLRVFSKEVRAFQSSAESAGLHGA